LPRGRRGDAPPPLWPPPGWHPPWGVDAAADADAAAAADTKSELGADADGDAVTDEACGELLSDEHAEDGPREGTAADAATAERMRAT